MFRFARRSPISNILYATLCDFCMLASTYKINVISYESNYSCLLPDPGLNGAELYSSVWSGNGLLVVAEPQECHQVRNIAHSSVSPLLSPLLMHHPHCPALSIVAFHSCPAVSDYIYSATATK